jgi:hypothetical protein
MFNTHKTKNVYVPLALIGLAIVFMLIEMLFISNNTSTGTLEGLATVAAEIVLCVLVLLLGTGLCSWFGYPFDPIHWSLLQLLAVTLSVGAVRGILGIVTGDSVAMLISVVLFLGLIGYFFSDEPMNALIAMFLIFASHLVVTFFLIPLLTMFLS